jgi:ABC-type sugar transport system ATPase subunit
LEQVGSPDVLYDTPGNLFVAGFIGGQRMNLLPVDGVHDVALQALDAGAAPSLALAGVAHVGVRPEDITLVDGSAARVDRVERMGAESLVHLRIGSAALTVLSGDRRIAMGDLVGLAARRHHRFDAAGRRMSPAAS